MTPIVHFFTIPFRFVVAVAALSIMLAQVVIIMYSAYWLVQTESLLFKCATMVLVAVTLKQTVQFIAEESHTLQLQKVQRTFADVNFCFDAYKYA